MEKLQKYEYDPMKWFCWSLGAAGHSDGVVRASVLKVCFETQKQPVFYKKAVLKCFAIFTRKYLSWSLFLTLLKNSITGVFLWILRNFYKKLRHRCFSVNIAKFLRTSILKNIWERLLLKTSRGMNSGDFRRESFQNYLQQQSVFEKKNKQLLSI